MDNTTPVNNIEQLPDTGWGWRTDNYCFLHRELTAWVLPVVYREDLAEDIATEVLLDYSNSPLETGLPVIIPFLIDRIHARLHQEQKRQKAEQAFAEVQKNEMSWPVRFQVQQRYEVLQGARKLPSIEQHFLKLSLLEELEPEEIENVLGVKGRTLKNIRDLAIIRLRKLLADASSLDNAESGAKPVIQRRNS